MATIVDAGSTGDAPPRLVLVSAPLATFWSDVLRATLFFSTLSDILQSTDKLANAVAEVRLGQLALGTHAGSRSRRL